MEAWDILQNMLFSKGKSCLRHNIKQNDTSHNDIDQ